MRRHCQEASIDPLWWAIDLFNDPLNGPYEWTGQPTSGWGAAWAQHGWATEPTERLRRMCPAAVDSEGGRTWRGV